MSLCFLIFFERTPDVLKIQVAGLRIRTGCPGRVYPIKYDFQHGRRRQYVSVSKGYAS